MNMILLLVYFIIHYFWNVYFVNNNELLLQITKYYQYFNEM